MITDEIDAITLEYFLNRNKFDNVLNSDSKNSNNVISLNDRKFYRKRIVQLTKDLFKKDAPNNSVKDSFDTYIRSCIAYFKFIDASDVMQEEYIDIEFSKDLENTDINDSVNPDELLYNKCEEIKTLDNFVKKTNTKKNQQILPQTKKIDIKSNELKIKGIRKNKKEKKKQDNTNNEK